MHVAKELTGWAFFAIVAGSLGSLVHVALIGGV